MARMKRGALVASTLVLLAFIAAACNQPYSQPPIVTNTPLPNNLFATPLGQGTDMTSVQDFATGTALAIQSGTPLVDVITATTDPNAVPIGGSPTITPTSIIQLPTNAVTTPTATMALSTGQPPAATSIPGTRPSTYTLQAGEFPYCIARRFNVDPSQLLSVNGLSEGQTLFPGKVLTIPQTGTFPGNRMLRNHPTTYTVASSSETLYSVACLFGDVDPSAIASANGLSLGAALTSGQTLSIP